MRRHPPLHLVDLVDLVDLVGHRGPRGVVGRRSAAGEVENVVG